MKNKYSELAKNTMIFACATLGSKIIMFFLMPLYTNMLSPEEYGTVELIITGINLLTPILSLSITDAVLRFGLDKDVSHSAVLKDSFIFLSAVSFIAILFEPIIRLYKPISEYTWLFIIVMIVFMFRSLFTFYLKSIGKNVTFAIDTIIYVFLLASFNIFFLVILKWKVTGYMLSLALASFFSIIFCIIVSGSLKDIIETKFDFLLLKRMLLYSIPLILNAISWWITNSSDKYMLEYFKSSSEVGLYSAASKIPALLSTLSTLFSQAWTLSSVKEYDSTKEKEFFSRIFNCYAVLMIFAAGFVLLITKPFMLIYVGIDFIESWKYVPVLLIASLFGGLSSFFGSIYVATRKNVNCTISTVICGATNIFFNAIFIPKFGVMGAAIATAISYAVVGVYRMMDCQRVFHFDISYNKHLFAVILIIIEAVFVILSQYRYVFSVGIIITLLIVYKSDFADILKLIKDTIKEKKS